MLSYSIIDDDFLEIIALLIGILLFLVFNHLGWNDMRFFYFFSLREIIEIILEVFTKKNRAFLIKIFKYLGWITSFRNYCDFYRIHYF